MSGDASFNGGLVDGRDSHPWLSAVPSSIAEAEMGHHLGRQDRRPSLPLLLLAFVGVVATLAGLTVVGVHSAVLYSGCPLGINGCNEFHNKEDKGFVLIRAVRQTVGPELPESLIYVAAGTVGTCVIGILLARLPEALAKQLRGGGTVQSLEAVATGEGITLVAALLRVVVSCLYLGTGGSLGMEGPAIHVCTALATLAGWSLGIRALQTQSLLASLGFSCGFAASFNSPLAGILFAMEELQHVSSRLSSSIICIILVASVVSTAVVRAFHGNVQLFQPSWEQATFDAVKGGSLDQVFGLHCWMLVAVPIGACSALAGRLLMSAVRWLHAALKEWNASGWLPTSAAFALHGLVVASVGALVFQVTGLRGVWGVGAESVQQILDHDGDFHALEYGLFAAGKLVSLALGIAVRGPGDVLEPVLISGGFLGGMSGRTIHWLGAGPEGAPSGVVVKPCVVFGMVGLFASCFRFPLTPIVIVLELMGSDSYALILPTVLASFTAMMVSNRLFCPLLDEIMWQDGIDLQALSVSALETSCAASGRLGSEPHSVEEGAIPAAGANADQADARSITKTSSASSHATMSVLGLRIEESLLEQTLWTQGAAVRRNTSKSSVRISNISHVEYDLPARRPSICSNASLNSRRSSRSSRSNGRSPMRGSNEPSSTAPTSAHCVAEGIVVEGSLRSPPTEQRMIPSLVGRGSMASDAGMPGPI